MMGMQHSSRYSSIVDTRNDRNLALVDTEYDLDLHLKLINVYRLNLWLQITLEVLGFVILASQFFLTTSADPNNFSVPLSDF